MMSRVYVYSACILPDGMRKPFVPLAPEWRFMVCSATQHKSPNVALPCHNPDLSTASASDTLLSWYRLQMCVDMMASRQDCSFVALADGTWFEKTRTVQHWSRVDRLERADDSFKTRVALICTPMRTVDRTCCFAEADSISITYMVGSWLLSRRLHTPEAHPASTAFPPSILYFSVPMIGLGFMHTFLLLGHVLTKYLQECPLNFDSL